MSDTRVSVRPYTVGPSYTSFVVTATSSGATFPPSITPLVWYKADVGVTGSSTNVTSVADQSGNGYDIVNYGNVGYSSIGLNGSKPALVFTQVGGLAPQGSSLPINMGTASPGPRSCFWVGTMQSSPSPSEYFLSMIGTAGHFDFSGGPCDMVIGIAGSAPTLRVYLSSADFTFGPPTRFGFVQSTAGTIQTYVNGVGGNVGVSTNSNSATVGLCLGREYKSGTPQAGVDLIGVISEVVLTATSFSSSQIADLDAYFVAKWGI